MGFIWTKSMVWAITGVLLLGFSQPIRGQFFKKLKQQAEEKLLDKASDEVDDIFKGNKNPEMEGDVEETGTIIGNEVKSGQHTSVQETIATYNEADYLVYKSPDPAFHDIYIQKYEGLPRFGSCDFYSMPSNPKRPEMTPEANEKRKKMQLGYAAFMQLVRIHTLKDHFEVMDRTALTPISKPLVEEEVKSNQAQKILLDFAFLMGTDALKKEYFMNDWTGTGNSAIVPKWGGQNSDDFTENEKYVAFVEKYLDKILQWSRTFFNKGSEDFQFVVPLEFKGQYDFDNNGFWVQLPTKRRFSYGMDYGSTGNNYFFEFHPKTAYGQQILNKTQQVEHINAEVLFKIDPSTAEGLINDKTKNPQMVIKVQVVFEGFQPGNPTIYAPKYTYRLLDPIMELYSDVRLTSKIGEIDLNNLVYKEQ
ncbi:hypothetical protein [Maribacter polysaccharolyticus]|uniref:hypothetical protein n=1 Tax=Maribacter polysaccharolyticus TaxID=3020831 RepID=UPI00237F040C|nr:hypothetical protein [Maribacter polysaccharolyticus]MDE3742086.1 hypothetical protein [Maribacter polysaccharolyticus]